MLKKKEAKLNSKACLKKAPPFVSSGVPAVSVPRVRPAPDKAHPCFGAEGLWCGEACKEAHLPPPPASRLLLQLCDSWRGWKLPSC